MVLIVHKTVHASTTGPATASLARVAVLLDTTATPVNTVRKHTLSHNEKRNLVTRLPDSGFADTYDYNTISNHTRKQLTPIQCLVCL